MSLLPENLSVEMVEQITTDAFAELSDKRGYEVSFGDCVCCFMAPLIAKRLTELDYSAEVVRQNLDDDSNNWVVALKNNTILDVTWFSMLQPGERNNLPKILMYDVDVKNVKGLNGETIPASTLADYFGQIVETA